MTEIKISDKQNYFNENYPFGDPPNLTDLNECIHCGNIITVGDYKVLKDDGGHKVQNRYPRAQNH